MAENNRVDENMQVFRKAVCDARNFAAVAGILREQLEPVLAEFTEFKQSAVPHQELDEEFSRCLSEAEAGLRALYWRLSTRDPNMTGPPQMWRAGPVVAEPEG